MKKGLDNLLSSTKNMLEHQKKVEFLKGETFNIFSVVGMEFRENAAHSSFIGELLNPRGTHLKGDLFLRLFLEVIENTAIDSTTAIVKKEFNAGPSDIIGETGGRIDLYIADAMKKSICIENKLYARDQEKQVIRYCNHNPGQNSVYYLTLFGDEPTVFSKGALKAGINFFCISYKDHILTWLEKCLKETVEIPILRETIRQYIILIKKLTNTMDTDQEKNFHKLMIRHYEESEYIRHNFENALNSEKSALRDMVVIRLREELGDEFIINEHEEITKTYAAIFLAFKDYYNDNLCFGIESFSGSHNSNFKGNLFIGILDPSGKGQQQKFAEAYNDWWLNVRQFTPCENIDINLSNKELLKKCTLEDNFQSKLVNHITREVVGYINKHRSELINYLQHRTGSK